MNPDKPVHAQNVPTDIPSDLTHGRANHEQIAGRAESIRRERKSPSGQDASIRLEAEAQLTAETESKPVSGTESRPYVDEPASPLRSHPKTRDPADSAVQTRSATDAKSKKTAGKLRHQ